MTDAVQVAIISGVLSATVTACVTYLGTVVKIKRDLEVTYDRDLRDKRVVVYKELWKHLEPLDKYARTGGFSVSLAKDLGQKLRVWSFETGGIFLSDRTRDAYFATQESLKTLCETNDLYEEEPIVGEQFEVIRKKGSTLRTLMTLDVGTRRRPLMGEAEES